MAKYLTVNRCDGWLIKDQMLVPLGEGGLNISGSTYCSTLSGWRASKIYGSPTYYYYNPGAMISKDPEVSSYTNTTPITGYPRGLYGFNFGPASHKDKLMACVYDSTNLTTLHYIGRSDDTAAFAAVWLVGPATTDRHYAYNTEAGTVTWTNGDATVTGAGTSFTSLKVGEFIRRAADERWYQILSITSDTELELTGNYGGVTGAGVLNATESFDDFNAHKEYAYDKTSEQVIFTTAFPRSTILHGPCKFKYNTTFTGGQYFAPQIRDKGGTLVQLTGTLTFTNDSTAVTGAGTSFATELEPGDWIQKAAGDGYWAEVASITNATTLVLNEAYEGGTGAGAANGSRRAPTFVHEKGVCPHYVHIWKNKLWFVATDAVSVSAGVKYTYQLYGSVTGDYEDFTSTGSFQMEVDLNAGDYSVCGITSDDDYLYIFKTHSYQVFRYVQDVDNPIELVREISYGCCSNRTIKRVQQGVIYLSSTGQIRMTDGANDICVSDALEAVKNPFTDCEYYLRGSGINAYPSAFVDTYRGVYGVNPGSYSAILYNYISNNIIGFQTVSGSVGVWANSDQSNVPIDYSGLGYTLFMGQSATNTVKRLTTYSYLDITTTGIYSMVETLPYCSGITGKKIKIYWLDISFVTSLFAVEVVDSNFTIYARFDNGTPETIGTANVARTGDGSAYQSAVPMRFRIPVNRVCDLFSLSLREGAVGGTAQNNCGIASYTICYDLME